MSDFTPDEERLAGVFAGEHASPSAARWGDRPPRRNHRPTMWAKPAAAAVAIAVVAGGLGGYFGLRGHLLGNGAASGGAYPAGRADAAIAYDEADGTVVMFGGFNNAGKVLGDTWIWDGSSWSEQHPSTSPPPLSEAVMAYDPATRELVLFGGSSQGPFAAISGSGCAVILPAPAGSSVAGPATPALPVPPSAPPTPSCKSSPAPASAAETWTWNGSTWHHAASGGLGLAVARTWAATDPATKRVLLVAMGLGSDAILCPATCDGLPGSGSDVQTWSWDRGKWQRIQAAFPATSPRGSFFGEPLGLVTDPVSGHLALVSQSFRVLACGGDISGGGTGSASSATAEPAPTSTGPAGAKPPIVPPQGPGPESCPVPGNANTGQPAESLTEWTGSGWGRIRGLTGGPESLVEGTLTSDLARHVLVFAGLQLAYREYSWASTTWVWNGSNWTSRSGATPDALGGGSAAFDPNTDQIVMFGGFGSKTQASGPKNLPVLNATWTWDGAKWTIRGGTNPPPLPNPTPEVVTPAGSPIPCVALGAPGGSTGAAAPPSACGCPPSGGSAVPPGVGLEPACPIPHPSGPPFHR